MEEKNTKKINKVQTKEEALRIIPGIVEGKKSFIKKLEEGLKRFQQENNSNIKDLETSRNEVLEKVNAKTNVQREKIEKKRNSLELQTSEYNSDSKIVKELEKAYIDKANAEKVLEKLNARLAEEATERDAIVKEKNDQKNLVRAKYSPEFKKVLELIAVKEEEISKINKTIQDSKDFISKHPSENQTERQKAIATKIIVALPDYEARLQSLNSEKDALDAKKDKLLSDCTDEIALIERVDSSYNQNIDKAEKAYAKTKKLFNYEKKVAEDASSLIEAYEQQEADKDVENQFVSYCEKAVKKTNRKIFKQIKQLKEINKEINEINRDNMQAKGSFYGAIETVNNKYYSKTLKDYIAEDVLKDESFIAEVKNIDEEIYDILVKNANANQNAEANTAEANVEDVPTADDSMVK